MRVAGYVCAAGLALFMTGLVAVPNARAAEAALDGAWLEQGSQCEEVFSRAGKAVGFKKPVNVFAPAFIIAGNRLRTPQASCRIKSVKSAGERRVLALSCATPVAVDDAKAILGMSGDGSLRRYFDEHDQTGS